MSSPVRDPDGDRRDIQDGDDKQRDHDRDLQPTRKGVTLHPPARERGASAGTASRATMKRVNVRGIRIGSLLNWAIGRDMKTTEAAG